MGEWKMTKEAKWRSRLRPAGVLREGGEGEGGVLGGEEAEGEREGGRGRRPGACLRRHHPGRLVASP